jgi:hypothetical protein
MQESASHGNPAKNKGDRHMLSRPATVLGIGACAAACAGIAVWPLFAGAGLAGFGVAGLFSGLSTEVLACLAIPAVGLGGWVAWRMARPRRVQANSVAATCSTECSCGSTSSPATKA